MELFNFSITGRGINLDYCDIEWFVLETNRNHSVILGIASKNCISDSFVNYEEETEPKRKQHPVVDVAGNGSKV